MTMEIPKMTQMDILGKSGGIKPTVGLQKIASDDITKTADITPKVTTKIPSGGGGSSLPSSNDISSDIASAKATKDLSPMERQKDYPTFLDPDKIAAFDGIWAAMRQSIQSGQKMA